MLVTLISNSWSSDSGTSRLPFATRRALLVRPNMTARLRCRAYVDRFHGAVSNANSYCLLIARRSCILQQTQSDEAAAARNQQAAEQKLGQIA